MKYEAFLSLFNQKKRHLSGSHKVIIPEDSWVNEACLTVNNLISAKNNGVSANKYFNKERLLYEKTISSFYQLEDLLKVFEIIDDVDKASYSVLIKKLKTVFNAPLLMMQENSNTNEGRNILFELRLFSRLITKGFSPRLSFGHPDIQLHINNHEYMFECKRPFNINTLVININNAINQLEKYSLRSTKNYGIVAISITRCIHLGKKRLEVSSELIAKTKLQQIMTNIVNSHRSGIFHNFPIKIPALMIELSDRAVIGNTNPYSVELIDIIETSQGRFSLFQTIKDDLAKFA